MACSSLKYTKSGFKEEVGKSRPRILRCSLASLSHLSLFTSDIYDDISQHFESMLVQIVKLC